MNFSIVFNHTGDSIPFRTINNQVADVLTYYVENLNQKKLNNFLSVNNIGPRIDQSLRNLDSALEESNSFIFELIDRYMLTCDLEDYLDPKILNRIHADWVNYQRLNYDIQQKRKQYNSSLTETIHDMFPDDIPVTTVATLLSKLNFQEKYNQINVMIHVIEILFDKIKFKVAGQEWVEMPNIFDKKLLTNNICNFVLPFNHLGRTLYNKFECFDLDLECDDENSFDELLGYVEIKLIQPQNLPLSNEYIDWAHRHNRYPIGDNLNIGNIPDLSHRILDYRKIIFKNTLQCNTFSIQLTKG